MLLSMTGYGEAYRQEDERAVRAEVRTVNNRYFKLSVRMPEGYSALEPRIEAIVRRHIKRGTVHVAVRIPRRPAAEDYRINETALLSYRRQLEAIGGELHLGEEPIGLESLLALPGVVDETAASEIDVEGQWPLVEAAIDEALRHVDQMRKKEGQAMAADLLANCEAVRSTLDQVQRQAPQVVDAYRTRITDRLTNLLSEFDVTVSAADVVREVGIYAERSDIAEEIVRLRSHLEQFDGIMNLPESSGRKLDFLTQEMFRETNTIGSKANDAEIALHVVEIKAAIERMREMIQNVE